MTTSNFGATPSSGSPLNSLAMRCRSAAAWATSALSTAIRPSGMPAFTSVCTTHRCAATLSTNTMCPQVRFVSTRFVIAANFGEVGSTPDDAAVFQS